MLYLIQIDLESHKAQLAFWLVIVTSIARYKGIHHEYQAKLAEMDTFLRTDIIGACISGLRNFFKWGSPYR